MTTKTRIVATKRDPRQVGGCNACHKETKPVVVLGVWHHNNGMEMRLCERCAKDAAVALLNGCQQRITDTRDVIGTSRPNEPQRQGVIARKAELPAAPKTKQVRAPKAKVNVPTPYRAQKVSR